MADKKSKIKQYDPKVIAAVMGVKEAEGGNGSGERTAEDRGGMRDLPSDIRHPASASASYTGYDIEDEAEAEAEGGYGMRIAETEAETEGGDGGGNGGRITEGGNGGGGRNLPSAHCHLPSAICQPPTAHCQPPSAICHLPTANRTLPSASDDDDVPVPGKPGLFLRPTEISPAVRKAIKAPPKKSKIVDLRRVAITSVKPPPDKLALLPEVEEFIRKNGLHECWVDKDNYAYMRREGYVRVDEVMCDLNERQKECCELPDAILMLIPQTEYDEREYRMLVEDALQKNNMKALTGFGVG